MVMKSLGTTVKQCVQANDRFSLTTCCDAAVPDDCLHSGFPQFRRYNFTFQKTARAALSWEDLTVQIGCTKKPIAFSWEYRGGGGGHMMVATGYNVIHGVNYVVIQDPLPVKVGYVNRTITYDTYVEDAAYTHWDDFYDVTPIATPSGTGTGS